MNVRGGKNVCDSAGNEEENVIAISYRREDSTSIAGRIHDRLQTEFGKPNVFMDFDSIPYGIDFRQHIKETLEKAKCVVVMIGPDWYGFRAKGRRRIDDPNDFVRLEVAGALQRNIPVIPVLVGNATMPKAESLPSDIAELAFRNGLVLDSGIDFHHHADRLVSGIRTAVGNKLPPALPPELPPTHHAITYSPPPGTGTSSKKRWFVAAGTVAAVLFAFLLVWLLTSYSYRMRPNNMAQPATPTPAPVIQTSPTVPRGAQGGVTQWNRRNPVPQPSSSPANSSEKIFAGTWQGIVHSNMTAANGATLRNWDSHVEVVIDPTETQWSGMPGGSILRRGRTLACSAVMNGTDGSRQQVHATLIVSDDGKTATYTTSSKPINGRSAHSFGKGTLQKLD